jgi:hypothetical protein
MVWSPTGESVIMPASYATFGDIKRTLVQGGANETIFLFATDGVDTSEAATVDYVVDPNGSCTYQIKVNGTAVDEPVSVNTGNPHSMRANFPGELLTDGGDNELTAILISGTANMAVGDFKVSFKTL